MWDIFYSASSTFWMYMTVKAIFGWCVCPIMWYILLHIWTRTPSGEVIWGASPPNIFVLMRRTTNFTNRKTNACTYNYKETKSADLCQFIINITRGNTDCLSRVISIAEMKKPLALDPNLISRRHRFKILPLGGATCNAILPRIVLLLSSVSMMKLLSSSVRKSHQLSRQKVLEPLTSKLMGVLRVCSGCCIDHVTVICSEYCDTGIGLSISIFKYNTRKAFSHSTSQDEFILVSDETKLNKYEIGHWAVGWLEIRQSFPPQKIVWTTTTFGKYFQEGQMTKWLKKLE